ncbi:MAG: hypothetical protein ACRD52_05160 [Candidatus Acidiferrales bacterium]
MLKTFIIAFTASLLGLAALGCMPARSAPGLGARQSASLPNQSKAQAGVTHPLPPATPASASSPAQSQMHATPPPPTDAEISSRARLLISNQHHDDQAFLEYERIERQVTRSGGPDAHVAEDKTYRVVPTGMGTYKILLKTWDKPVEPAEYRRELENWAAALQVAMNPEDPKTQSITGKFQKKNRDRSDLVDASRTAFIPKWLQSETFHGRLCDVLELDPNPDFHPRNLTEEAMTHVMAKIWVDHASNQLARGEAHVIRDIPVGAGILGKVYRGSSFSFEQAEAAPGVWLPTRYEYDYSGRKFLFAFEQHQKIDVSDYRRDGPPQHALGIVRAELDGGKADAGDP